MLWSKEDFLMLYSSLLLLNFSIIFVCGKKRERFEGNYDKFVVKKIKKDLHNKNMIFNIIRNYKRDLIDNRV